MGMGAGAGDRVDWFGASPGSRAVKERSASEVRDDGLLVEAARAGDRVAFGRLYERYARMVHGILMARVPPGEVDDLVQDVFVMALRRLSSLREIGSFGGWLAAITRNRANDYHRSSVAVVECCEELRASERESGPVGYATGNTGAGEAATILAAIRSLPDAYKETLILRLVEGMTGPEIAARTGLTPGSVRVNLHRGMQQLRERLERTPAGSEGQQERSSS
jgi:RNA polymerase sigma-70 factor (ECF subfamily)